MWRRKLNVVVVLLQMRMLLLMLMLLLTFLRLDECVRSDGGRRYGEREEKQKWSVDLCLCCSVLMLFSFSTPELHTLLI